MLSLRSKIRFFVIGCSFGALGGLLETIAIILFAGFQATLVSTVVKAFEIGPPFGRGKAPG
jgi:hypothetical protein